MLLAAVGGWGMACLFGEDGRPRQTVGKVGATCRKAFRADSVDWWGRSVCVDPAATEEARARPVERRKHCRDHVAAKGLRTGGVHQVRGGRALSCPALAAVEWARVCRRAPVGCGPNFPAIAIGVMDGGDYRDLAEAGPGPCSPSRLLRSVDGGNSRDSSPRLVLRATGRESNRVLFARRAPRTTDRADYSELHRRGAFRPMERGRSRELGAGSFEPEIPARGRSRPRNWFDQQWRRRGCSDAIGKGTRTVCETRGRQEGIASAGRISGPEYSDCLLGAARCGRGGRARRGAQVAVEPT